MNQSIHLTGQAMEESAVLISVIVPIYKVEPYLKRCVDSILSQTYQNLEIILVDDGSPDNCGQICDDLAKTDSRIKVIHKPNGGLSDARNAGLEIAKGELIGFVDSDDFIHPDMYKDLLDQIKKNNADIAQCSFIRVTGDEKIPSNEPENLRIVSNLEALEYIYTPYCVDFIVAWNKLYKKELFKDLRFPKSKIHEDEFTTYKLFYRSKKIALIDRKYYYYFQSPNSIIRSSFSVKKLDYAEAMEERIAFFKENKLDAFYALAQKKYALWLLNFYYRNYKAINKSTEVKSLIIGKYKAQEKLIRENNAYTTRLRKTLQIAPAVNPLVGFLVYHQMYKKNIFSRIANFLQLN
ncbi:MAG: glycosyltransferase [Prolixibacteraceae bacterium]|nr:glycosyltransferase [Prolixibacteraceae bacterium]